MTTGDAALDDAWQAALAAEHQAVFGYALLGPQLRGGDLGLAVTCSDAHEDLRNRTEAAIAAAGLQPVQSRADYPSLYPVDGATAARTLAVRLEDDCAAAWRFLFSVAAGTDAAGRSATPSPAALRSAAQDALTASAVRAVRWRTAMGADDPTVAFPGLHTS